MNRRRRALRPPRPAVGHRAVKRPVPLDLPKRANRSTRRAELLYLTARQLPVFVAPLLALAVIAGFLAGNHRAQPAPKEQSLLAHQAGIALEYPSGWRPAAGAPPIPGLAIAHPLLLAPGGNAARAGLLSGQLPAGEAAPLPAAFVALMPELPRTEVVSFLDVRAYKYTRLRLPAYGPTLELYVIPGAASNATAIACYASPGAVSYLRQCEQIVATLTPVGHPAYDLKPSARYSSRLGAVIGEMDGERLIIRRQMGVLRTPRAVAGLATTLADRFATAAAAIRALHPPPPAAAAQTALVASVERAGESYRELATAASGPAAAAAAAQAHVGSAEAGVDGALATFALLGYKHT
jgi:hypothetical protein